VLTPPVKWQHCKLDLLPFMVHFFHGALQLVDKGVEIGCMSHCVCLNYWHHITKQYDQLEVCKLPEKWGSWVRQDKFCLWIMVETS